MRNLLCLTYTLYGISRGWCEVSGKLSAIYKIKRSALTSDFGNSNAITKLLKSAKDSTLENDKVKPVNFISHQWTKHGSKGSVERMD